jgi:transposase
MREKEMLKVELYERIRADSRAEGLSVRGLAAKHDVHRRTVRAALSSAVPPARKTPERVSPVLGPWTEITRAWLVADRDMPTKQRHTARRVWRRLVDEYGAQVAESTVRAYVAKVNFELDSALRVVTVPQSHLPGDEAECDFGEFWASVAGVATKLWMFCLRLSHSGDAFHVAFSHQAQEAFLEGHVLGFAALGGVPVRVRYDNLKAAVAKVLFGRVRVETERFIALRSHYGFDSFYCHPGIEGADEKGGVEGEIGRFRRNALVPMPAVGSLAELNEVMAAADRADRARRIGFRPSSVGEMADAERPTLGVLPEVGFDPAAELVAKVDTKGRVCVRQSFYSVPVGLARHQVLVRLGAQHLTVVADGVVVAAHERSLHKGSEDLVLDHYLEILERKPGALPGSTALAQARASGTFTATHERFWTSARTRLGDGPGTRALIGVLLLQRHHRAAAVIAGMDACLAVGVFDPDVVAIEARRAAAGPTAVIIPIGTASPDRRSVPTLAGYDSLLTAGARS